MKESSRHSLHLRLLACLRHTVPVQVADYEDSELLHKIEAAQENASRFGVRSEQGIANWVLRSLAVSPAFTTIQKLRSSYALARQASSLLRPLHPDLWVVAQPGGAVVRGAHDETIAPWRA